MIEWKKVKSDNYSSFFGEINSYAFNRPDVLSGKLNGALIVWNASFDSYCFFNEYGVDWRKAGNPNTGGKVQEVLNYRVSM